MGISRSLMCICARSGRRRYATHELSRPSSPVAGNALSKRLTVILNAGPGGGKEEEPLTSLGTGLSALLGLIED